MNLLDLPIHIIVIGWLYRRLIAHDNPPQANVTTTKDMFEAEDSAIRSIMVSDVKTSRITNLLIKQIWKYRMKKVVEYQRLVDLGVVYVVVVPLGKEDDCSE